MKALNTCVVALGIAVLLVGVSGRLVSAQRYSDWSPPVNLGPVINSSFNEGNPAISKDGLSLYFASNRPGGIGGNDIWVAHRDSLDSPWSSAPLNLGSINTIFNEVAPALSRDEHYLFFVSNRPGGAGGPDIWVSFRQQAHDDGEFAWETPFNLGSPINTPFQDSTPSYFENEELGRPQLFFTSNRTGGSGGFDIYLSELQADGTFGPATLLPELSGPQNDYYPSAFRSGLQIFFASDRLGTEGGNDLWVSIRENVFDPWSAPVNLGLTVNSVSNDQAPNISSDGQTLFFASDRSGGYGGIDIYMTTRTKLRGPK
jgi:Tol biopolymer transport system component